MSPNSYTPFDVITTITSTSLSARGETLLVVVIHSDNGVQINADSLRWNCCRTKIALAKCQGVASDNVTDGGGVTAIY